MKVPDISGSGCVPPWDQSAVGGGSTGELNVHPAWSGVAACLTSEELAHVSMVESQGTLWGKCMKCNTCMDHSHMNSSKHLRISVHKTAWSR